MKSLIEVSRPRSLEQFPAIISHAFFLRTLISSRAFYALDQVFKLKASNLFLLSLSLILFMIGQYFRFESIWLRDGLEGARIQVVSLYQEYLEGAWYRSERAVESLEGAPSR